MIDKSSFNVDMLPVLKPFTGDDVIALRAELGVSQTVLAMIFSVSDSTVKSWERRRGENALKGGDLVLANKLKSVGLSGYLYGSTGEAVNKDLQEAAYTVLTEAKEQRSGFLVKPEAIESLRSALGLRSEKNLATMAIRQAKAKAVGSFASAMGDIIETSFSLKEIEERFKELMITTASEA